MHLALAPRGLGDSRACVMRAGCSGLEVPIAGGAPCGGPHSWWGVWVCVGVCGARGVACGVGIANHVAHYVADSPSPLIYRRSVARPALGEARRPCGML